MSPRTGRPPKEEPRSLGIHIRVTPREKEAIMEYSKQSGKTCRELLWLGIEADKKKYDYCEAHGITRAEAIRNGIHLLLAQEK